MQIFLAKLSSIRNAYAAKFGATLRSHFTIATLAAVCVGCTSVPPTHFYTLNTETLGSKTSIPSLAEKKETPPIKPAAKFYIEVDAVPIPAQVDRPQFVITIAPGQVEIKEQQRWAASLQDEIRQVLSEALMEQLGTFDVARTHIARDLPVYRITAKVQRFTSSLTPSTHAPTSGNATLSVLWSVRLIPAHTTSQTPTFTCYSFASETVKPTYRNLVLGHRRAIHRIAQDIAFTIRSLAAKPDAIHTMPCPTANE